MEFGLDTFGDVTAATDGRLHSHADVIREVIAQAALAEEIGINAFGVGEHHRPDFAISAPEVVLGAIATRTKHIILGSAVTVLSSDDPIRVFERFSTFDAASNGRAEVTLGRGSFTESFPLFGFDLAQYEELFDEKLDLFAMLLKQEPVTWQGQLRPPLANQRVYPPLDRPPLKTWIGVGGSPQSVVRAAHYDLPLMLAIIGGDPNRFRPMSISTIGPSHNLAGRFVKSACTTAVSPKPMKKHETDSGQTIKRCAIGLAPNVAGRR